MRSIQGLRTDAVYATVDWLQDPALPQHGNASAARKSTGGEGSITRKKLKKQ